MKENKEFTVRTFYYEEDKIVYAYTTYQGTGNKHEKIYKIKAKSGDEAKRIAIKQRKLEEQKEPVTE